MIVERIVRSLRLIAACGLVGALTATVGWGQVELRNPASGTYDVIALRVEFQADTSRFSTGSGTFGGDPYGGLEPAVDPLPHDAAYFQAHLDFLSDYVERVSDGIVNVRTHLLSEVVHVAKPMAAYAPTGPDADSDEELSKLAALVRDSWAQAEVELDFDMSGFDPQKTAFAIFHAGVGRDIELIGTTLEKTPEDLPSLFFDERALSRLGVGEISFNGFPVDHTMILPRTETRRGTDFIADEPFLLELSINGLLAASFFNFLGVPDLFDTESGASAIGPFGLMDAQGIFAYRGLFPPEPMAWTKYFLGWTEPTRLGGRGPETVTLEAASVFGASESARVAISDAEYFLVENRYRDPEHDGLTLRVWKDGTVVEQHVENGDTEFNTSNVEGFVGGVVVGVDNYDWALPGGLDEDDNPLNGGILIWHVDERRLRAGLPRNAVNVGTDNRGVDLEEADGAQDLGFASGPFGPQAELGTPFDFFFRGNPVTVITAGNREIRLYENRFGPDTFPSSETNAGGPSFIVLDEFSEPAAEMTFGYAQVSVEGIEPIHLENAEAVEDAILSAGLTFGPSSSVTSTADVPFVYSLVDSTVVVLTSAETLSASTEPVAEDDRLIFLTRSEEGTLRLRSVPFIGEPGPPEWSVELPPESAGMMPVSPLVANSSDVYYAILRSATDSWLMEASPSEAQLREAAAYGRLLGITGAGEGQAGDVVVVGTDGAGFPGEPPRWTYDLDANAVLGSPVLGQDHGGLLGALPVRSHGEMMLLLGDGRIQTIDVANKAAFAAEQTDSLAAGSGLSAYPVLADFDGDGYLDALIAYGSRLFAFTQSGAVVAGFPKLLPANISAQPLVARFSDDEGWTIFTAADDGYLYAHDKQGLARGFPLEVGTSARATPLIHGNRLYAVSEKGTVKAWELPPLEEIWWGELHRDAHNGSFAVLPEDPGDDGDRASLIDASETYNWPNPIEAGSTHLRIRTARNARVRVMIIDAGGALVEKLDFGLVPAGIPSEIVWQADVESGLYFARFTATTEDGETESRVVKMAVIR